MKEYEKWDNLFRQQNLFPFNNDETGIVWLKLKSINRKEILKSFIDKLGIENKHGLSTKDIYNFYLKDKISTKDIDNFLNYYNKKEITETEKNFKKIEAGLYKLNNFSWGGDSSNSLDKQIVSIIKKTPDYNEICKKIENEISLNAYNYTICSWYNNWTAILTEYIFKSNKKVLSAVGKIKSVDFFINNIPFDLKITYFPKEFLKFKRKELSYPPEMSKLKKIAKTLDITFDSKEKDDILKYQLTEQILDSKNASAIEELKNIEKENRTIINHAISNKIELIKWLYENQGEMRFGAENRIFLILINKKKLSDSWKLKRDFTLQKEFINNYLESFDEEKIKKNTIEFTYNGNNYKALADAIFISV